MQRSRFAGSVVLAGALALIPLASARADQLLWQVGKPDDSAAEFSDYKKLGTFTPPSDFKSRTNWKAFPKGMRGSTNPAIDLSFNLSAVPANGVMFSFKLLNAPKSGPQMAVFSNGEMAGLIQLWGTAETSSPYQWKKTYQLYIPREMLKAGANVLRLETARPMWSNESVDDRIWWEWDYLKLESLSEPAREPIHGKLTYLGTTLKHSGHDFKVNDETVAMAKVVLPWMGIAYSGNTMRADFWYDVANAQPGRLDLLKQLAAMNMTVMADNVSGSHFRLDAEGQIPENIRQAIDSFFQQYGSYVQYFELGNEPCMFGGGYAEYLAEAKHISKARPAHLKLAAAGWAYGGGKGTPVNWDAETALRAKIEAYCQATNGHSYGYSYGDNHGGSFVENLATCGGVEDGWPKDSVNSETGTNDWHSDENGPHFASTQSKAQAFDRIMRAHIAVVDRTMQHAAIFDDFSLLKSQASWEDPSSASAYPGVGGQDSRLKTFRRLALAYATHGAPLPYTVTNLGEISGKKVYFRAVDTAAIPAQVGSGATSNKILLNFVNFEPSAQTLKVHVTLPAAGSYATERFGPAETYAAARRTMTLNASPALELSESLGAGESVQYILTPPGPLTPYAPANLTATPGDGQVILHWTASSGATGYDIKRTSRTGPFTTIATNVSGTTYLDAGVANGDTCLYVVCANNSAGQSCDSMQADTVVGSPTIPTNVSAQSGNRQVSLNWSASSGAKTYRVLRSQNKGMSYQAIGETAEAQYVDKAASNGVAYRYQITAVNQWGESRVSEVVTCTPDAPPAAPGGVVAIAGDQRTVISWKAVAGATTYSVKRSTTAGGPYSVLASDIAGTQYTDDAVTNGTCYYCVVSASKLGPEGADSAETAAQPAAKPLPAAWMQQDIGNVGRPGAAGYTPASGTFTILGSGDDVWGKADGMHIAYQPLTGDGSLTAHVVSYDSTHAWVKIGLVIRETLEPDAAMAMAAVGPGGAGLTTRATNGGECTHSGGAFHPWIRISRKGNKISAFLSDDGRQWQPLASANVTMGQKAFIGMAVCSHNNQVLNKTLFDHVTLEK